MLMFRKKPISLDPLRPITVANLPRCLESVMAIRERVPGLFSEGMTDDRAANVLGALNTNSHEVCCAVLCLCARRFGGGGGAWRKRQDGWKACGVLF